MRAKPRRRFWLTILAVPVVLYAAWAATMYFGQDRLIFPGVNHPRLAAAGPTQAGVQQVWITAEDGSRVEAWYQAGAGCSAERPGPALIYFHGNYDLVDTGWWVASQAVPAGLSTLVMEYRGYGRAGGKPSQAALVADGVGSYDWLAARPEVDRSRIVIQGLSLGGAVAAAVAEQRRPAALVLECTFSSMAAMAHRYALPGFLCKYPFETDRVLPTLGVPIAIYHGRRDRTIPVENGRRLHALAPGSVYTELDCGHEDFRHEWEDVAAFLRTAGILGEKPSSAPRRAGN